MNPRIFRGVSCALLALCAALPMRALAQTNPWTRVAAEAEPIDGATARQGAGLRAAVSQALASRPRLPAAYELFALDRGAMRDYIAHAEQGDSTVTLPLPDGSVQRFGLTPSSVLPATLAARYSEVRVFRARGVDDPSLVASVTEGASGIEAWIRTPDGLVLVEPVDGSASGVHLVYRRAALPGREPFACEVHRRPRGGAPEPEVALHGLHIVAQQASIPAPARSYVLALAATGEYTQYHGGTVGGALAAMVTAIDRVNTIFEAETGVTLVLHPNTDQLIYTNPSTDPYSNEVNAEQLTNVHQPNVDATIGNANYDVGHLFTTGNGGLAWVQSVCWTGNKARGSTGLPNPVGDPFYVDYVAHELGHQFGADHTFNADSGLCMSAGQRSAVTAFEPGSGSTIMGYAGLCAPQNLQSNSDPYFHFSSLSDIEAYVADDRPDWGGDPACVALTVTGNQTPDVDAGPDFTIPLQTPFELTGSATDDVSVSSYVWEQADLGPPSSSGSFGSDDGQGPLFRSYPPTGAATRTFPKMSDVLSGANDPAEVLPALARPRPNALTFKLVARDADPRGGGWGIDEMEIEVDGGSGPFAVTSPNGGETIQGATTVTWDVAGTDLAPVSCADVDVVFSSDAGATFDQVLLAATPNDGSEVVVFPQVSASQARLLVRCAQSIFFDVSDGDFAVVPLGSLPFLDGFETGDTRNWSQASP